MLTRTDLIREAAATGFQAEPLEKVIRLLGLLDALRSHPFLKTRIALKGGTALNLFAFDVPRLSVDIDLNYLGAAKRETMQADRPKVEQAVQAVCGRLGIGIKRSPDGHACSSMIAEATFRQCCPLPRMSGSSSGVSTRRAISFPSCLPATRLCRPTIRDHPGLKWKAQNVKKHFGIASDEEGQAPAGRHYDPNMSDIFFRLRTETAEPGRS